MRDAYNPPSGANNFMPLSRAFIGWLTAVRTNSHGEGIVIYCYSKSIVAAFVASAVMAAFRG